MRKQGTVLFEVEPHRERINGFNGIDILATAYLVAGFTLLQVPFRCGSVEFRPVMELDTLSQVVGDGLLDGIRIPGCGKHGNEIPLDIEVRKRFQTAEYGGLASANLFRAPEIRRDNVCDNPHRAAALRLYCCRRRGRSRFG